MDANEFRAALKELGISQQQFARDIDTDPTAVNRWANGKSKVSGAAAAYLRLRLKVQTLISEK